MENEIHVSGLVVHVRPSDVKLVHDAIGRLHGAEVHAATADGRFVVTLESASEADTLARVAEIARMPGVLSAGLAYHRVLGSANPSREDP